MSECVDKTVSEGSKILNLTDTSLDMQGSLDVSRTLRRSCGHLGDENAETLSKQSYIKRIVIKKLASDN